MNVHENLKHICDLIKKQFNKDLEDIGLTFSQSGILMFILINKDQKINQRDIEKEFGLSNPTVNGILNRLEDKRLVRRINDENDKRIKNIIPLAKAENFMNQVKEKKDNMEKNMLKNIKQEEIDIFCNILEKITINLKEETNERNI